MDAKITKKRLASMLSYDWIKILFVAVAIIFTWVIVFSISSTKITPPQQFSILHYSGVTAGKDFSGSGEAAKRSNVFSYDIIDVATTVLGKQNSSVHDLLDARLQTEEGDVMFAIDSRYNTDMEYEVDGVTYTPSYLDQFLMRYENFACKVDGEKGILTDLKNYLLRYYEDESFSSMDEAAVSVDFKARVKKLNDKRFDSKKEFQKGLKKEKERIALLKDNYLEFLGYLNEGIITLENSVFHRENYDHSFIRYEGNYAINLNKDGKHKNSKLMDLAYGFKQSEEGKKTQTTENLCVVLLDPAKEKYDYGKYESISYVNYIVREYILP